MRHLDNPLEAFESESIDRLVQYKEGQHFDRKRKSQPKDFAQWLVGFANANLSGGILLLGVDDDCTIIGLKAAYGKDYDYRNEIRRCGEYVSHVVPQCKFLPVKTAKDEDDEICIVYVPYSTQVATTSNGDVYLRIGDQNKKLQPDEIVQLRQERGQDIPFSNLPTGVVVRAAQLHSGVVSDYLQRTGGQTQAIELERVLLNRHLAIEVRGENYLTKAGLLLLAQDPRYEIPGAFVRFLKYEGREALYGENLNVVQDETFFGPIPLVAQRLRDYIPTQLRQFRYLGGDKKFIVDPELPEDAWFEVIINALVHRAYHMVNDSIVIRLFEDRLEVISPGSYPTGVNPSEFPSGDVSRPRNVTIMNFMRDIQYVQMYHEGTKRIFAAMEA
ncbi:MAG: putative DNA binding domain-containing protein, partial [Coleofasciculus sp. S288]|nr:putative DNA binding domain-containing protein [Coleofasciculus sp. S288]